MAIKIPNGHKIYQTFPLPGLPKYINIMFFGMQISNLATLLQEPIFRTVNVGFVPTLKASLP
jgi:hypothetical protein